MFKNIKIQKTYNLTVGVVTATILLAVVMFINPAAASASTITVDSANDNAAGGDGDCTLREAIANANNAGGGDTTAGDCATGASGSDTIEFEITSGGVSFTNQGQTGYTISLNSALPVINEQIIFNGYTQNGAQSNTAIAPSPLNGILLVQIDGSALVNGSEGLWFNGGVSGASGSAVRGLILNGFAGARAILIDTTNVKIQGNYIGTNPAGTALTTSLDKNSVGVSSLTSSGNPKTGTLIGGVDSEDRNILSGQEDAAVYPTDGWILQGNYVGIGADGITAIPNSSVTTPGAISIDLCNGVIVGGEAEGATNVISGNASHGVAPLGATNLLIAGNIIGADYTGEVAVPNRVGIVFSGNMSGGVIGGNTPQARNIVSGNSLLGIAGAGSGQLRIEGNYVGLDIQGLNPIPNNAGILIGGDEKVGGAISARNVVSGNSIFNVSLQNLNSPSSGAIVSGNYIGTNASGNIDLAITAVQGEGIRVAGQVSNALIGQSSNIAGTIGNLIAGNRGAGVGIRQTTVSGFGTITAVNSAVLGNQIYGNIVGGPITGQQGLGIDLYEATIDNITFPADLQADSYVNTGVTPNDVTDADIGINNYMNAPVINSVSQNRNNVSIDFNLDAANSTDGNYRVEFFTNDEADATGYGEGQSYLGSATVAVGTNRIANIFVPDGTDLTGKKITGTTTAINNTTPSGYGSTSEFSLASDTNVIAPATSGGLANTGVNIIIPSLFAGALMLSGGAMAVHRLTRR
jgi:CSLREA domain-containing protein